MYVYICISLNPKLETLNSIYGLQDDWVSRVA